MSTARGTTHYQVLGLPRDASSVDIANAFREKLAEAKARGSEERVEAISNAYRVLASPVARAQYDAELPPDARQRRELARQEREPNRLVEILEEMSGPKRIALLAVTIFFLFMVWKVWPHRVPVAPAAAAPASRTVIEPTTEDPTAALRQQERERRAIVARPMTAEEIFSAVSPSIVKVVAPDGSGGISQGSGVVTGGGVVITNCHVVTNDSQIQVKQGNQTYSASVRVADRDLDLCSLSVAGLTAPPVTMSTFDAKVGQRVYAIGAPQGLELTLSEGIISALRATDNGAIIQTSAPVSPGSSGGGLFNTSAQLVGVVTFQAKSGQNLNFALPAAWISEMTSRDSSTGLAPAR